MFVDDGTRIRHMLDTAKEAVGYTLGRVESDLDTDGMLYHAVKDCVTIVGEAAYKVSRVYQDAHPEIPWRTLIRFRHELVHDYFRIDTEVLWNTVTELFVGLIEPLETLVTQDFSG